MITYKDSQAYETIQKDVIDNLNLYLNKEDSDDFVIVVVGAYHGYEINNLICRYPNSVVYAFEAHPAHYSELVARFKDISSVNCYNVVVSDEESEVMFYELSLPGSGSILEFIDDGYNRIVDAFKVASVRLCDYVPSDIDLLWCDVQGAELMVLKSVDLSKVGSLFLEVLIDGGKDYYKGNCYFSELESRLELTHYLYSIGLDNESNNGTGNAFWLRKDNYEK